MSTDIKLERQKVVTQEFEMEASCCFYMKRTGRYFQIFKNLEKNPTNEQRGPHQCKVHSEANP